IGAESNVQDGCVVHVDRGRPTRIGARVTVGHGAIVHASVIEDDVLVAMKAVVLSGCQIGRHTLIGAGAVVPEGTRVPEGSRVLDPAGSVEIFNEADHDAWVRDADLIFMLDNSALNRLGALEPAIRGARGTTVCVDHHNVIEPFWALNIIDEDACATGELV